MLATGVLPPAANSASTTAAAPAAAGPLPPSSGLPGSGSSAESPAHQSRPPAGQTTGRRAGESRVMSEVHSNKGPSLIVAGARRPAVAPTAAVAPTRAGLAQQQRWRVPVLFQQQRHCCHEPGWYPAGLSPVQSSCPVISAAFEANTSGRHAPGWYPAAQSSAHARTGPAGGGTGAC